MFLLGAGASLPAGLPDIRQMTEEFYKKVEEDEELNNFKENINILRKVVNSYFVEKQDLESFMTLLKRLYGQSDNDLFYTKYENLKKISLHDIASIYGYTQNFVRCKLESESKTDPSDYMDPLKGFLIIGKPLEIFTLNYDGVIDLFCEKNELSYTDGFSPFWNPIEFDKEYQVKLYRLHGCLYWFSTKHGKSMRIPLKGIDLKKIKYISDSELSEMIIYPTLQKEKYSEIYSSLSNRFIYSMKNVNILFVIGYSFRDDDITNNIKHEVEVNSNLWVIIIDPCADSYISNYFRYDDPGDLGISSRIVSINLKFESILRFGRLYMLMNMLQNNISKEKQLWIEQHNISIRSDWNPLLENYKKLGMNKRIQYVDKKLRNYVDGKYVDDLIGKSSKHAYLFKDVV